MIDKTDDIYKENENALRKIESGKRGERFKIPIPVIGEAFHKLNEKRTFDVKKDAFKTLEQLIVKKRIELIAFGNSNDAFRYAKELMDCCYSPYRQDNLDPMDALIVADALIDNQCQKIYTNDNTLLFNVDLHDRVNEIRKEIDPSYPHLSFAQL